MMHRKVIRICAEDSPNVREGTRLERSGVRNPNPAVVPGVLSYWEYKQRRATWDTRRQKVGLDAQFYDGPEEFLFPLEWRERAKQLHRDLTARGVKRIARALGVDAAEGGDDTAWAVVDDLGLIKLVAKKTTNTAVIVSDTLALMREYNIPADKVMFDRGGGGKQHADRLRAMGYQVRTVGFGEPVTLEVRHGTHRLGERKENKEERYVYVNRRAEMYGDLSIIGDPNDPNGKGFAISETEHELLRQLSKMPKKYDGESRLYLPPKDKKDPDSGVKTLKEILGCSPDEADALVVAVYARDHKRPISVAGVG